MIGSPRPSLDACRTCGVPFFLHLNQFCHEALRTQEAFNDLSAPNHGVDASAQSPACGLQFPRQTALRLVKGRQ